MHNNIYDISFSGIGGGMYRSWVGLNDEKVDRPACLDNWSQEDLESYVAGPYFPRSN